MMKKDTILGNSTAASSSKKSLPMLLPQWRIRHRPKNNNPKRSVPPLVCSNTTSSFVSSKPRVIRRSRSLPNSVVKKRHHAHQPQTTNNNNNKFSILQQQQQQLTTRCCKGSSKWGLSDPRLQDVPQWLLALLLRRPKEYGGPSNRYKLPNFSSKHDKNNKATAWTSDVVSQRKKKMMIPKRRRDTPPEDGLLGLAILSDDGSNESENW